MLTLKINDEQFSKFTFSERWISNSMIELYTTIDFNSLKDARNYMLSVSNKPNTKIELLYGTSTVQTYESKPNEIFKEISANEGCFRLSFSLLVDINELEVDNE